MLTATAEELSTITRSSWFRCPPRERFWTRVEFTDDCWLWQGGVNAHGYGSFHIREDDRDRTIAAHRFAWLDLVGEIPEGKELDHLCRTRLCVRPEHLEPVAHIENVRRGDVGVSSSVRGKAKTHCAYGHEYTPENTHIRSNGSRTCKACWPRWRKRNGN